MGNQKYCSECALFTRELRVELSYYKGSLNALRNKNFKKKILEENDK